MKSSTAQIMTVANHSMKLLAGALLLGSAIIFSSMSHALTFTIPDNGNVVGNVYKAKVKRGDTLATIGRRYNIGGYEMKEANPGVPFTSPRPGTMLTIPSQFVLPPTEHKGIVINLAEMRLYYYHKDGQKVSTYPIGIGKMGWLTPIGKTQIVRKRANPTWVVPKSIYENHRRHGKTINKSYPPGPDNPLGKYAMNLGFKNIVIHGTPYPGGVGLRSSHGCIRMLPEDIKELFSMASVGTPVKIIHEPTKVGRMNNILYLESHLPLRESVYQSQATLPQQITKAAKAQGYEQYDVHWNKVKYMKRNSIGFPKPIGKMTN